MQEIPTEAMVFRRNFVFYIKATYTGESLLCVCGCSFSFFYTDQSVKL